MAALLNPPFPQEPGPAVPQPADPGQLAGNPPLWIAAPTGAQNNGLGGPVIEVRIADIFRFPADAIIVPTDADMQRSRYGPFPHKWHRYAGRNLGAYNEHVHRPGGISAIAGLPSTTSAVKSLSMLTENNEWVIMANVPDFNPYGPAAGGPPGAGFTGNSRDLAQVLFAALRIATLDDSNVPAAILPLLRGALPPGTPIDPATGLPPLPRTIAIPFIGGIGQRGWAPEVVSKIFMNCILTLFFSPLYGLASRTKYCAAVDRISIIIPRTVRFGITASVAALEADFMQVFGAPVAGAAPGNPGGANHTWGGGPPLPALPAAAGPARGRGRPRGSGISRGAVRGRRRGRPRARGSGVQGRGAPG